MPPRDRSRLDEHPPHRPLAFRHHLADEYEALGNLQVAHELRRHLRGHAGDLYRYLRSQGRA